MRLHLILFLIFFCTNVSYINAFIPNSTISLNKDGGVKMYSREYYQNGNIKAEGWEIGEVKVGYWIFYYPNGNVLAKGHFRNNTKNGYWYYYNQMGELGKEGHYLNGSAEHWWIFYDLAKHRVSKFQYKDNQKNGYALRYHKKKLMKAEKYLNDKKEGEWTSIWSFKRDNPGISLR